MLFCFRDALESLREVGNIPPGSILVHLVVGMFHRLFSGYLDDMIISGLAGVVLTLFVDIATIPALVVGDPSG